MGEIKIPPKPDAKTVKQRPYRLNPRYINNVKLKLERMLDIGIIELVEESKCISLMVV